MSEFNNKNDVFKVAELVSERKNLGVNSHVKREFEIPSNSGIEKQVLCLSLADLQLEGDDLGDDFQLECTCAGATSIVTLQKLEKKLIPKHRDFATVWLEPGQSILTLKILAREIDPIADDIGQQELQINSLAIEAEARALDLNIEIFGRGRGESKLRANLKIKLAVTRSPGVVQIKDVDPNGWVLARARADVSIPLPAGIAVELTSLKDGRENFVVLEGVHKGTDASIALDENGITHLTRLLTRDQAIAMKLIRDRWVLQIPDVGEFEVMKMEPAETIYPGTYNICLPDSPHQPGKRFRSKARHAESWFRIGDEGDRYIHPGSRTKGCVTVKDLAAWEIIYSHLIKGRLDNGHIGTLEVT